jgi:hypothetical protein
MSPREPKIVALEKRASTALERVPAPLTAVSAPTALDAPPPLSAVLSGDESAWRAFVTYYEPRLRSVVRHASEATPDPLRDDEVDDVLGDFWLNVVTNDKKMLRVFDPRRGSDLLTWLTFHVAHLAYERLAERSDTPTTVSLRNARKVADPHDAPQPKLRSEIGAAGSIDAAIRECVRTTVVSVVREELATANRDRDREEADRPRSAAWWAEHLGCSAESLVKRAKRGSLEYVKIGARYYFTRAQIDGSRRWQRLTRGSKDDA